MLRLAFATVALAVSLQAQATPASPASIESALTLMRAEQSLGMIWGPVEANLRQAVARKYAPTAPPTPEQQAADERQVQRAVAVMREQMSWQKLKPQYVKLYADTFTQEEIDGLVAFYSSPAGQAYLAKMPVLLQHTMQMMQAQMQELMPKLMQTMADPAPAP